MNSKEEFVILLDLLAQAISTVQVSTIDDPNERERATAAHNLANRFVQYAITVLHLSDDTNVENLPSFGNISVIDPASIDVLTRASMEAFLVFHYVFYSPASRDEKDYRYWTYKAAGLAERQNLPEDTFEHAQQKAEERKSLEDVYDKLESNAIFQSLTHKQKREIVQGNERNLWRLWRWRPDAKKFMSWQAIATDAGFSKIIAEHMYRHLSGHAHSSSLSVLQTQQAVVRRETDQLISPSLDTMKVLTANLIHEYTALFQEAQHVLIKSGASTFVDTWIRVGQRL